VLALDRLALLPAIMRNVQHGDIGGSLLGMPMALPVFPAPIGSLDLLCADGAAASVRAAGAAGTICCVGLLSHPDFIAVASQRAGPLMLQLYIRGDQDWLADIVRRAEQAGYDALVLTADSVIYARRDSDLANGYAARRAVDRTSAIGPQE
jgi:isopentenyl diphosphate isomerase/L-lactate dehydrogenase-like FMN-dependent dehydrogenase